MTLVNLPDKEHPFQALQVKDNDILSNKSRQAVTNLPLKLPMICLPKPYAKDLLGGYLNNDVRFSEGLVIDKKAYIDASEISTDNRVYSLINNINSTPFKINKDLLDYISSHGLKHNLLMDPFAEHKF
jgi:DNA-directed RNA polymerase